MTTLTWYRGWSRGTDWMETGCEHTATLCVKRGRGFTAITRSNVVEDSGVYGTQVEMCCTGPDGRLPVSQEVTAVLRRWAAHMVQAMHTGRQPLVLTTPVTERQPS